jgi:hypothetical protein
MHHLNNLIFQYTEIDVQLLQKCFAKWGYAIELMIAYLRHDFEIECLFILMPPRYPQLRPAKL